MGYSGTLAPVWKELGFPWGPNVVLTIPAGAGTYTINSFPAGYVSWYPYQLITAYIDLFVGSIEDTSGATNFLSLMNTGLEYDDNFGGVWHDAGVNVPSLYCKASTVMPGGRFNGYEDVSSWLRPLENKQIDWRITTDGANGNSLKLWNVYPILRMYLQ